MNERAGKYFAILRTNISDYLSHDVTESEEQIIASNKSLSDFYLRMAR